jgi:hypothetical protein
MCVRIGMCTIFIGCWVWVVMVLFAQGRVDITLMAPDGNPI